MIVRSSVLLLAAVLATTAHATDTESRFEVGLRLMLVTAGGTPANDMMAAGIYGKYRFREKWRVGFAVDSLTGDYERPYEVVGLESSEEIDSTIDSVVLSGWIEREYGRSGRKLRWFWTAGLGFASPDTDDVTGPTSTGGMFDITTDAGSETLVGVSAGLRRIFARRWQFEAAVRADHHFTEWVIIDRVSGQTGTIDDYTTHGLQVGIAYRF